MNVESRTNAKRTVDRRLGTPRLRKRRTKHNQKTHSAEDCRERRLKKILARLREEEQKKRKLTRGGRYYNGIKTIGPLAPTKTRKNHRKHRRI